MSSLKCPLVTVKVQDHPNADRLDVVIPDGLSVVCVSGKGNFSAGDKAVYIPEGSLVPVDILKRLDLWDEAHQKGKLAGSQGNRVKTICLRGVYSQGLLLPHEDLGLDDYANELGITKWIPPVPIEFSGKAESQPDVMFKYDIENIQLYPDVFKEDQGVMITEKLHGTLCAVVYHKVDGKWTIHVGSKGMLASGIVFSNTAQNKDNLYVKAVRDAFLDLKIAKIFDHLYLNKGKEVEKIYIFGELTGKKVQDLAYDEERKVRVFDIAIQCNDCGIPTPQFLDYTDFTTLTELFDIETVPVLYVGPYSKEVVEQHTSGKSTLANHIREGVVIKPLVEYRDLKLGRVILKSVSREYLVRKGGTEYN